MQGAKSNQEDCLRLAERATEIFYAIVNQTVERKDDIPQVLYQGFDQLASYVFFHNSTSKIHI